MGMKVYQNRINLKKILNLLTKWLDKCMYSLKLWQINYFVEEITYQPNKNRNKKKWK